MVKTAVILAAGRGTRLKELGTEIPKGFLQLGTKPIIEESIEKLFASGVERVVIVTGHIARKYEELAARFGGRIVTVHNDRYAESGSLYSLYLAGKALQLIRKEGSGETTAPRGEDHASKTGRAVPAGPRSKSAGEKPRPSVREQGPGSSSPPENPAHFVQSETPPAPHEVVLSNATDINGDGFLLLESDLVYEGRALQALQQDPRPDLILVSGRTNSGDEVWVATRGGNLFAMSKDRSKLEELAGHELAEGRPPEDRQSRLNVQEDPQLEQKGAQQEPTQAREVVREPRRSRETMREPHHARETNGELDRAKSSGRKDAICAKAKIDEKAEGDASPDISNVNILGELVGISKISMSLFARLTRVAEGLFEKTLHVEYETGLTETARDYSIPCLLIPDLVWAEIDDVRHLERARRLYQFLL